MQVPVPSLLVHRPAFAAAVAALAVLSLTSCRGPELPLAPGNTASGMPLTRDAALDARVPMLRSVQFRRGADSLFVTAHFVPRDPRVRTFFDPYTPGGWSFQMFLDADHQPTGYWRGYDLIVRGVELAADHTIPIRLTSGMPVGPGGWGPVVARVPLESQGLRVKFSIPLDELAIDDAPCDFALETYLTEPCDGCETGVTYVSVADYFGAAASAINRPLAYESPHERRDLRPGGLVGHLIR
jgi:hypothetical protein